MRHAIHNTTPNITKTVLDKTGKEMLTPQYAWAGDFTDGKAFVTEKNGKTWLIDKSGKKVQFITEGLPVIQEGRTVVW